MPRLPTPVVVLAWLVLVAGAIVMVIGAYQIGITWDEKTNMLSLQNFFDQGWNITKDAIVDGRPDPNYIWGVYVYGPVSLLFTHALSTLAGLESWGQVSLDADAYAVRHVGGALIGLLGVAAAAITVRVITRSWRWAVLGGAMLAIVPMWTGHSMMNIKDGPVASGYAVATLGLVLILRDDYLTRRSVRILGLLALFGGAFLASGTRAASGVPIAGGVILACAVWWLLARVGGGPEGARPFRDALRRLVEAGLALTATYLALVALYPNVWINPIMLAYQAVVVSARFPFDEPILFAGQWVDQPVPWTYLPGWFAAQLPLLVLVGALGFLGYWAVQAVRILLRKGTSLSRETTAMTTAVVLQAVSMPVVAILLKATMYNGVRQFLFLVPAMSVLATLGVWSLARWMRSRAGEGDRGRVPRIVMWSVVGIGLISPMVSQVLLFPYTYAYFNVVAALQPIDGTWSTDYWRASSNEIMRRLPADGPESCAYEQSRKDELHPCALEPMFVPYLDERGTAARPGGLEPGQYWLVRENEGYTVIPPGCTLHDDITRPLFGQTITIAQIMRCDADAVVPANGELGPQ